MGDSRAQKHLAILVGILILMRVNRDFMVDSGLWLIVFPLTIYIVFVGFACFQDTSEPMKWIGSAILTLCVLGHLFGKGFS